MQTAAGEMKALARRTISLVLWLLLAWICLPAPLKEALARSMVKSAEKNPDDLARTLFNGQHDEVVDAMSEVMKFPPAGMEDELAEAYFKARDVFRGCLKGLGRHAQIDACKFPEGTIYRGPNRRASRCFGSEIIVHEGLAKVEPERKWVELALNNKGIDGIVERPDGLYDIAQRKSFDPLEAAYSHPDQKIAEANFRNRMNEYIRALKGLDQIEARQRGMKAIEIETGKIAKRELHIGIRPNYGDKAIGDWTKIFMREQNSDIFQIRLFEVDLNHFKEVFL